METLHQLIHELSPTEKRYIKWLAGDTSERFMALFDAINAQAAPDEEGLRLHFQEKGWFKNFSEAKRRLTELILRGLRHYNDGRSPKLEVLNLLEEMDLLFTKGQYSLLTKRLQKADRLATEAELPELELIILDWYHRLQDHPAAHSPLSRSAVGKEFRHRLEQLCLLPEVFRVSQQTNQLILRQGYPCPDEAALAELGANIQQLKRRLPSHKGRFLEAHAIDTFTFMHLLMANQITEAYGVTCRIVDRCLALGKTAQAEKLYTIANAFQYQMGLAVELEAHHQLLEHLETFRAFLAQPHIQRAKDPLEKQSRFRLTYYAITANMFLGRAAETEAAMAEAENRMNQLNQDVYWRIFLQLRVALAAFVLGEFRRAKAYIVSLQEHGGLRSDLHNLLSALRFMVEYELGNHELAESLFRQGKRLLQGKGLDLPEDRRLLVLLWRLMSQKSDQATSAQELADYLGQMLEAPGNTKTKTEIRFLLCWARSQLAGHRMIEEFRRMTEEPSTQPGQSRLSSAS